MSDVRCPSCGDVFRVPDFALPEGAVAGCPCCRSRFAVSDLRLALPPLAELLDASGAPLSVQWLPHAAAESTGSNREQSAFAPAPGEAADLQSGMPSNRPVPPGMVSDDRLPAAATSPTMGQASALSRSHDAPSETKDPQDSDFSVADESLDLGVGVAQEPRPLEQVTAFEFADAPSAIPRPRGRRPASPLRSLISIVLGGLLALPLAGILLALIGKPLDLGFWPFLGKQYELPIAIRAGEAASLDDRPRPSRSLSERGGRSLGEDMGLLAQPDSESEQPSASDRPAAAGPAESAAPSGLAGEKAPPALPSKPTAPTTPAKPSSGPSAALPRGLELPVGTDATAEQAATRAAEIAAMPAESNLFHDDHRVLIAEPESDAPLAATAQPANRAETTQGAATPEPAVAATPHAASVAPASPQGGTGSEQPPQLAGPTGLAADASTTEENRVQTAPQPSEATTGEPRQNAAPRVAAAPERSTAPREGDIAPPLTPRAAPAPAAPAPVAPAPVSPAPAAPAPVSPALTSPAPAVAPAKSPESQTLPKLPATRGEPKAATATSPPAALKQQPRPLSQAMRTELASMETAIQTLVNHRESDGTTVLKRRWADLYLAMARAGAIAEPQDQAELASLIRRMVDSDLIGPLSMMAANWMRISNRPSDGVLVVGPVEQKDGKTFIRWRGMVPLEVRGLDPSLESSTDPILILGRILSSDAAAPVVEVTFAESQAG